MIEYSRQVNLFNPEDSNLEITIIGAGSTGSFVGLNLAKMGIKKIRVIDFDKVESHNIPNQFYRTSDIGKPKVEALKEIIKDFTDIDIEAENIKINRKYEFDLNINSLVILCVDTIKARKLIFNKIKDFPIIMIDTRFGGEGFSIHTVDLADDEESNKFRKSLDLKTKDTVCGEKAIIYTILSLASEICNIVKKIDKEEPFPTILRRELKTYRFISNLK